MFIPKVALRIDNVYDKYIMEMNSLNAFFYIWLNYIDIDQIHVKNMCEEVIEWLKKIKGKNMVTSFLSFTIGYFLFENNIKMDSLKQLYKEVVVEENRKHEFNRAMYSQIFYLTKNFNNEVFQYRTQLNTYIKWLEG